jgi:predicted unusual protein kinase regulating ubiquinone biosynthesis (AarF/ABC1/UbiB family)
MSLAGPRRQRRSVADRRRRTLVEECLGRWDLLRRPQRLEAVREGAPSAAPLGPRLRGALAELGPLFSAFGLYLASRLDLVAAGDALDLAALTEWVPPLPADAFRERIAVELGRPASDAFADLEAEPFESRLFLQTHRGRLAGGGPVIVRLVRAEAAAEIEADLELLPLLGEALVAQGWTSAAAREAVAGFQQSLRERLDLRSAAEGLGLLAADAATFSRLAAPPVYQDLSTARLLTIGDLGGVSLGEVIRAAAGRPGMPPAELGEWAQSLCTVWLRQVLAGRVFPVELGEEDVRALPDGRIGLQGIVFARLPAAVQADLKEALLAVAFRDPDGACSALVREMARDESATPVEELRLRLRQIVPFRDGAWTPSGESLAEHCFLYARTARACGYRLRRHLLAFYRGLFAAALAGRRLAPARDCLRDGLQELRLLTGASQVREAVSFESWGGQLDRYALLLAALPQRLDELLTLAAEGRARPAPEPAGPRPGESSHLVLAASLMVLAALALLLHHFVEAGALAGRGETIGAVLFLAAGGMVLWLMGRTR